MFKQTDLRVPLWVEPIKRLVTQTIVFISPAVKFAQNNSFIGETSDLRKINYRSTKRPKKPKVSDGTEHFNSSGHKWEGIQYI